MTLDFGLATFGSRLIAAHLNLKIKNKLVTVFSALAVAAGIAHGEVKSANVVGYDNGTTASGYNFVGIPFAEIGYNTANIKNLKLSGAQGFGGELLEIWNGSPAATVGYTYFDASMDMNGVATEPFWGDDNFEAVNVSIQPAIAVVLSGFAPDLTKTTEGEVLADNQTFKTVSGYNFIANPFAGALPIQNIKLSGAQGFGGELLEIWNGSPAATVGYTYFDASMDMNGVATEPFWGDDNFEAVNVSIQPGQGFVLSGFDAGLDGEIVVPYDL